MIPVSEGFTRESTVSDVRCQMSDVGGARSVKGNVTRTTSPWLKLIVDGILGIVPELECGLCRFEPADIVRLNFQVRRQIMKQPYLVAHIQVLDCFADFLNRAHKGNLSKLSAIDQPSCNPTTPNVFASRQAWRGSHGYDVRLGFK